MQEVPHSWRFRYRMNVHDPRGSVVSFAGESSAAEIEEAVPVELDIHLILDNYGTHKTRLIQRWLVKRPRFHLHFTPTGSSWINLVERWFALLTEKQIRRGVFRSTHELEKTIRHFIETHNEGPKPFIWAKTADEILNSIARFCKRTSESGH